MRLLLLILSLSTTVAHAREGWDSGNAGDAFASEFRLTAKDLWQRLRLINAADLKPYGLDKLKAAIDSTEVTSQEHTILRGQERDAINYWPDRPLIDVSRSRWRELRKSTETTSRLRVVLHEYLWVSGYPDEDYQLSDRLIAMLNIKNYSPGRWWSPVNPVNQVSAALVGSGADCEIAPGKFNVESNSETVELKTPLACGTTRARRVSIVKTAGMTPPSSNVRGLFHRYLIKVFDSADRPVGEVEFEPEWGECLVPEAGACRVSGKLTLGGVELGFWFLRE